MLKGTRGDSQYSPHSRVTRSECGLRCKVGRPLACLNDDDDDGLSYVGGSDSENSIHSILTQ